MRKKICLRKLNRVNLISIVSRHYRHKKKSKKRDKNVYTIYVKKNVSIRCSSRPSAFERIVPIQ